MPILRREHILCRTDEGSADRMKPQTDRCEDSRSAPAGWLILLALILTLTAALRFWRIDAQSLWYDEGNSAYAAAQPVREIVAAAARDIHPPGYYILLAGWEDLVGRSELALRMFSALAGVLTVALVYAIGTRFFERPTGALAALLVAVNPFQVWYAQEARMYALLALFSAASVWLTAAVLTIPAEMTAGRFRPRRAALILVAYTLVNAAGLYTHYTFPFVLLAESLVFLIWLLGRPRKRHGLLTWAALQFAALVLYVPWLPAAIRQVTTWPRVPAPLVGLEQAGTAIAYGLTTPPDAARGGLIPLLLLGIVGLFPPPEEPRRYLHFGERLGLVALWLLVPVAIPFALGVVREAFLKFFLPAGLAFWLLIARGVVMGFRLGKPLPGMGGLGGAMTRLATVILLAVGLLPIYGGLHNLYFEAAYARDDYRAIARRILAEDGPHAAVVLDAPNQAQVFGYYFPLGPNVATLPDAHTEETLERLLADHRRIYALYYGEAEQDPQRVVEQMLSARAFVAETQWYGDVRLVIYAAPIDATAVEKPSGAHFGDSIVLEGYALSAETLAPGEALAVTLFWRPLAPINVRYKVFVHLYGPDGAIAAQHDGEPGGGLRPTDTWTSGERIADRHGLLLPPDAAPGTYTLAVGLYDAEGSRLPVVDAHVLPDNRLWLGDLTVAPSP